MVTTLTAETDIRPNVPELEGWKHVLELTR